MLGIFVKGEREAFISIIKKKWKRGKDPKRQLGPGGPALEGIYENETARKGQRCCGKEQLLLRET